MIIKQWTFLESFKSAFADRKVKRRSLRGFLDSETLSPWDINYSKWLKVIGESKIQNAKTLWRMPSISC